MQTHYDILELSPDCEDADIKAAFRKLAMRFHPDRTAEEPEAAEKFLEVRAAYEILIDPDLREEYDQYLVEAYDEFEYEEGYGPEPEPVFEPSGPEMSGGRGFGREDDPKGTPFMFMLWVLLPLIVGGLVIEFFDAPAMAIIAAAGSILLLLWINEELKRS